MLPAGPNQLTGAYVAAFREHHKISRDTWAEKVGITGGPQWRIEKKNTFKESERAVTWSAVEALGGPIELDVIGEVAPTNFRGGDGATGSGEKKKSTRRSSLPQVDLTTPVVCISPEFVPPAFTNDHGAPTDPADEEEVSPSFVVTTETLPIAEPANVIPLPAGWEHFYPPSDPRHLHRFLRNENRCLNATCAATATGFDSVADPDEITPEKIKELIRVASEVDTPYEGQVLPVKVSGDVRALSNSEMEDARRCRRRWWLSWYLGLREKNEDKFGHMAIGDRVHRALAGWYVPEGQTRVDPRDGLERAIVEDWTVVNAWANDAGMDAEYLAGLATRYMKVNSLERAMVEGYVEWIAETGADSQLVITGSEVALAAPVQVQVNGEPVPVEIIGKLDARYHRLSDGRRGFMDHKTVGSLKEPLLTLVGNNQMYQYILLEFLNTPDGELACDTALYNMLRRVKRTATANPPFYDRVEVRHTVPELEFYKTEVEQVATEIVEMTRKLDAGADPLKIAYRTWRTTCKDDCPHFMICPLFNDRGSRANDALAERYVQTDPLRRYEGLEVVRPT